MILSNDKAFVILTPTKTGTFSLEASLRAFPEGFFQRMPRHGSTIPPAWRGAQVLVVCRNPYARLVSMFTYGKVKKHSWLLAAGRWGFEDFVFNWLEARERGKPHDWITLVREYVASANQQGHGVNVFALERDGLAKVLRKVGAPPLPKHINKSHDRFHAPWESLWTPELVQAVRPVLLPDERLGRYSPPC